MQGRQMHGTLPALNPFHTLTLNPKPQLEFSVDAAPHSARTRPPPRRLVIVCHHGHTRASWPDAFCFPSAWSRLAPCAYVRFYEFASEVGVWHLHAPARALTASRGAGVQVALLSPLVQREVMRYGTGSKESPVLLPKQVGPDMLRLVLEYCRFHRAPDRSDKVGARALGAYVRTLPRKEHAPRPHACVPPAAV